MRPGRHSAATAQSLDCARTMSSNTWVTASTRWWPLELASGISWLFLFGAGFYIGPALVILDSLVRAYEHVSGWRATRLDVVISQSNYYERMVGKAQERVSLLRLGV